MSNYDITTYLKYANLQMAAEAINLTDGLTNGDLSKALKIGNDRSSSQMNTLFMGRKTLLHHNENHFTSNTHSHNLLQAQGDFRC